MSDRRLFVKPLDDGQALFGAVLSADDAVRAFSRCDDAARGCKHAGAADTLDQLRCDAFTDIMLRYPAPATATTGPDLDLDRAADDTCSPHRRAPGKWAPVPRPVTVSVVVSLTSLLGLDSKSGWLDGYGAITAGAVQRIVSTGDVTLRRLLCDPITGATIVSDPTRYTPSAGLAHAVSCRDRRCRLPVCDARIRQLDRIQAKADAGLTTSDNLHGLCERSHLAKHHPGWGVTGDADTVVIWQTPTGHRYPSLPAPATGYGSGPPGELDNPLHLPTWLSHQQRLRHELAMSNPSPTATHANQWARADRDS